MSSDGLAEDRQSRKISNPCDDLLDGAVAFVSCALCPSVDWEAMTRITKTALSAIAAISSTDIGMRPFHLSAQKALTYVETACASHSQASLQTNILLKKDTAPQQFDIRLH